MTSSLLSVNIDQLRSSCLTKEITVSLNKPEMHATASPSPAWLLFSSFQRVFFALSRLGTPRIRYDLRGCQGYPRNQKDLQSLPLFQDLTPHYCKYGK